MVRSGYINDEMMANCLTCLYGNLVSERFGVRPPTLEEYFAMDEVEVPARVI